MEKGQENDTDEMKLVLCCLFLKLINGFMRIFYTTPSIFVCLKCSLIKKKSLEK